MEIPDFSPICISLLNKNIVCCLNINIKSVNNRASKNSFSDWFISRSHVSRQVRRAIHLRAKAEMTFPQRFWNCFEKLLGTAIGESKATFKRIMSKMKHSSPNSLWRGHFANYVTTSRSYDRIGQSWIESRKLYVKLWNCTVPIHPFFTLFKDTPLICKFSITFISKNENRKTLVFHLS